MASALLGGCAALQEHRSESRDPAYHVVRRGDSLPWIARGYGIDERRLASANGLRGSSQLKVGQRLVIPDHRRIEHRVRRGETVPEIARRYKVSESTIARINWLGSSRRVEPGQRLTLPREAQLPLPMQEARAPRPTPARALPDGLQDAEALLERAVDDYRGARFERAIERAREADDAIAKLDDVPAKRSLGARSAFVEGSALAALGQNDRAVEAYARVHERDPKFEPPEGWLSPRLEELYRTALSH